MTDACTIPLLSREPWELEISIANVRLESKLFEKVNKFIYKNQSSWYYCIRRLPLKFFAIILLCGIVFTGACFLLERGEDNLFTFETESGECALPNLDPWDPSIRKYIGRKRKPLKCSYFEPQLTYIDHESQRIFFNETKMTENGYNLQNLMCDFRCCEKYEHDDFNSHCNEWAKLNNGTLITCNIVDIRYFHVNDNRKTQFYTNTHNTHVQPELTYLHNESQLILFNDTEMSGNGYYNLQDLQCDFRCFGKKKGDDFNLHYDEWAKLENGTFVNCELVDVRCFTVNNTREKPFYANTHSQIVPLMPELKHENSADQAEPIMDRPNIILFIVDSMSHSSYRRNLPGVMDVLKKDYNSFIFDGFVKVGENSFPNAMAFLTGKSVTNESEWPHDYANDYCDDWPLVYKEYKKRGYATFHAEDMVGFQLFTYGYKGFRHQPVDHHYRPFLVHLAKNSPTAKGTQLPCFGNNLRYKLQMDYLSQFIRKYLPDHGESENGKFTQTRRRPIFALNWLAELTHHNNFVSLADDDISKFLRESAPFIANNSFVFVMGDHGARFNAMRETAIGRIEEQMPFFSMHVPPRLLEMYPRLYETLHANTKRLATWWDLYITFREILHYGVSDEWHELNEFSNQTEAQFREKYDSFRGLSLFRALPARNCARASIPPAFCVCQRETAIDSNGETAMAAGAKLVAHVNELLAKGTANEGELCAPLILESVNHAQVYQTNAHVVRTDFKWFSKKDSAEYEYRITVRVAPSDAVLEGTLRQIGTANSDLFVVLGDVSRLNKYGDQSICTKSAILKKYCFCK